MARERQFGRERWHLAVSALMASHAGIMITDAQRRILEVNPACSRITGFAAAELIGQRPSLLSSGRHDADFYRGMLESIADRGAWQGEIWNRRKDGQVVPLWLTINAVRDESGRATHYVANFIDISQLKESQLRLEYQASHDSLTGLPNRLMLQARLQHAIERARRDSTIGAVLFLDLDHFRAVIDNYGHRAGEELLSQVAERLKARVRDSDTLARVGADDFVVLLENLRDAESAAAVAQSLIEVLGRPFPLQSGRELFMGSSIGISVFPGDSDAADEMIAHADTAMHQAKKAGRNTFRYYTDSLTAVADARVKLDASLRRGLQRDEFLLHYQPVVALDAGRAVGVEALVRWQRPGHGLVAPKQFIPLAEETGAIVALGEQVLRSACRQMKQWLDDGLKLDTIAVNLSPSQFQRPDLAAAVGRILEETGLPPGCLELEITETTLLDFADEAESRLQALKRLGVRLAIDDFGVGYSSLRILRDLPIDRLKLGRSFMRQIPGDKGSAAVVEAALGLARGMDLELVAVGVETEQQLEFLRRLACPAAQGYLLGRPVRPVELELALRSGEKR